MKKLLLLTCLLWSVEAFAQKDISKKICRAWVPDKEAMLKALEGKPEYERIKKDMEREDLFLYFQKNGTLSLGERSKVKNISWSYDAQTNEISSSPDNVGFQIKELTAQKFVFVIKGKNKENVLYFKPASKAQTANIMQRIQEASKSPQETAPKKAEEGN